jgi:hypothetical protein
MNSAHRANFTGDSHLVIRWGGAVALLFDLDNPERVSGSTCHLINGAGHFMMLEKSLEFNEILSGFLKNIAA